MVDRGGTTQRLARAFAGVALVVSGCAGAAQSAEPSLTTTTTSSSAAASQEASEQPSGPIACAEPTAVASPSETPALSFLPAGSRVRVVADGLCLRTVPNEASEATMTLPAGSEIGIDGSFDQWGPVVEAGLAWYPVQPGEPGFGWVAGERDDTRYLELLTFDCPADVDTTTVLRMTPWERLSCFGDEVIELRGVVEVQCQGGARSETSVYEPEWLARWCFGAGLSDRTSPTVEPTGWLQFALSPSLTTVPEPGMVVRMVGHFDDPAAASCHVIPSTDLEWSQPAVQLLCREQFVVTEVEVTGHMDLLPVG